MTFYSAPLLSYLDWKYQDLLDVATRHIFGATVKQNDSLIQQTLTAKWLFVAFSNQRMLNCKGATRVIDPAPVPAQTPQPSPLYLPGSTVQKLLELWKAQGRELSLQSLGSASTFCGGLSLITTLTLKCLQLSLHQGEHAPRKALKTTQTTGFGTCTCRHRDFTLRAAQTSGYPHTAGFQGMLLWDRDNSLWLMFLQDKSQPAIPSIFRDMHP